MPKLLPDQSFYPSPTMAMQAPAETLAYVALLNPDPTASDALAVLDVDPASRLRRADRAREHARRRRRAAPLRMERVQLVPVPELAAPAHAAALLVVPGMVVADSHSGHGARPRQPRLVKVIEADEVIRKTGLPPATAHCGPDGIYINALGNARATAWRHLRARPGDIRDQGRWENDRGPQHLRTTSGGTSGTTR